MNAPFPTCEFCGKQLDPRLPGIRRKVTGWETVREGGGGHGLSLRVSSGMFAHKMCIEELQAKHIDQDSLF